MIPSYTYFIRSKITNQFYYGSRYKNIKLNRHPSEDLWIHYFTSSRTIKQLIDQHGIDSFDVKIIKETISYDECYWYEQELIKNNINNMLCLNKRYVNPITKKNCFSFAGSVHSDITKQKISKSQSGEGNGFYGKNHSAEAKQKMSAWTISNKTGKSLSDETKQKISAAHTGKKRMPFTAEHKEKIRQANLGKKHPHSAETKQKIKDAIAALKINEKRI